MLVDLKKLLGRFGRRIDLENQVIAYRKVFGSIMAKETVLPDLAEFCGAVYPAPIESDLFKQGRAAGRRDVWLRLQNHLNLSEQEVYALLKGNPIITEEDRNA